MHLSTLHSASYHNIYIHTQAHRKMYIIAYANIRIRILDDYPLLVMSRLTETEQVIFKTKN